MVVRNRIITVFGGSGFIGRHLVPRLARLGATTVRVVCRHPGRAAFLKTAGDVGQVIPMAADIRDDQSVAAVAHGSDVVINLIGILYETGLWRFQQVQAEAPGRIARVARAAGASRLIQVSAIGADPNSASVYARTKAQGEAAVRAAFPEATILRPSIVFGAEDGFFNLFASLAIRSPFLPLIGGGTTRFQPVYVGDVAEAVIAALGRPESQGGIYELGGPGIYSFRQLMELLLHEIRRSRMLLPIPWWLAGLQARLLEQLPKPLLTRDQLELLKVDNLASPDRPGFAELGIAPTAVELVVPHYLERFRPGGRFSTSRVA